METAISPPKSVPIYYDDPSEHAFSAYYPYQEDSKLTEDKITVTTDATAQQNQSSIDFLFASGATGSTYNPDVKFTDENEEWRPEQLLPPLHEPNHIHV